MPHVASAVETGYEIFLKQDMKLSQKKKDFHNIKNLIHTEKPKILLTLRFQIEMYVK